MQPDPTKLADLCEAAEVCPSCGSALMECIGTDHNGEDVRSFQCHDSECYEVFDASEIISEPVEPPMTDPRDVDTLERWGFKWQGHDHGTHVQMPDGYWTPWHIAATTITALQAEVARLNLVNKALRMQRDTARATLGQQP